MNTTRRKSHCTSAAIVMALSCCVLFTPARAAASDSVERWNIAMTDYAAGQPPPGLPPFVEARAFSMAHIAMLDALRVARASTAPANVNAAIAAAAHDVLVSAFAPFGPNLFDSAIRASLPRFRMGRPRRAAFRSARRRRLRCSLPGRRGHIRRH